MLKIKEYKRVESLEEAWQLNQKKSNKIISGMLWMQMSNLSLQTAIDLSGLGLDKIEEEEDCFKIGCMTTLRQLETHEGLNQYTDGAVKEALCHIVGVQFRNLATVGGSVFGRYGFSDVLTILQSMDCYVELYKGGQIPIREFAAMKHDNDVLVKIVIKKTPAKYVYQSVRNTVTDFPVLACAAGVIGDEVRISVGARPGKAILVTDTEKILAGIGDGPVTEDKAEAFAQYVEEQVVTGSNMRGSAQYRSHLVKVLTLRAVQKLGGASDVN